MVRESKPRTAAYFLRDMNSQIHLSYLPRKFTAKADRYFSSYGHSSYRKKGKYLAKSKTDDECQQILNRVHRNIFIQRHINYWIVPWTEPSIRWVSSSRVDSSGKGETDTQTPPNSGGDFCWRIEAPKAPRGVGCGEGVFRFLSSKRRVLVHSGCNFCS